MCAHYRALCAHQGGCYHALCAREGPCYRAGSRSLSSRYTYEAAKKKGRSFIELYDHTHIESNVREFLDYFVPRKVMAGNEFILKTCPRVIRKLLRWMREKKLVELTNDEIKDMCENQLWEDTVRDLGF
jgi:hypothetical protein